MSFTNFANGVKSALSSTVKSTGSAAKKKKEESSALTGSEYTAPTDTGGINYPSNSITNGNALNGWQLVEQAGGQGSQSGGSTMLSGLGAAVVANAQKNGAYVPYDSSGNDYAGLVGMSDIDRAALAAATQSWQQANAAGNQEAMDAAHQQAEAIRKKYGYLGGDDGSQYIPFATAPAVEPFTYEKAPEYTSAYQDLINTATKRVLNREAFAYDPETDPLYRQYEDSYTKNGGLAMRDVLGQVSARTGGLASSYAATAAQQSYNNYMDQLADKIPELQQLAYQMYLNEGDMDRADVEMLMSLENADYNRYLNSLSQYNTDRSFAYDQYRNTVADDRYANDWNYSAQRDAVADDRYQDELTYQREQDELEKQRYDQEYAQTQKTAAEETARSNAWMKLQNGVVPTAEELALLGMTQSQAEGLARMWKLSLMGYY